MFPSLAVLLVSNSLHRPLSSLHQRLEGAGQVSFVGQTHALGDYQTEDEAARAFDRAQIQRGKLEALNFPKEDYDHELQKLSGTIFVWRTSPGGYSPLVNQLCCSHKLKLSEYESLCVLSDDLYDAG